MGGSAKPGKMCFSLFSHGREKGNRWEKELLGVCENRLTLFQRLIGGVDGQAGNAIFWGHLYRRLKFANRRRKNAMSIRSWSVKGWLRARSRMKCHNNATRSDCVQWSMYERISVPRCSWRGKVLALSKSEVLGMPATRHDDGWDRAHVRFARSPRLSCLPRNLPARVTAR